MTPFGFFFGEAELRFDLSAAADILNLCVLNRLPYRKAVSRDNGFYITVSLWDAKKLAADAENNGILPCSVIQKGLPSVFFRYRKRIGLMIGGGFLAALLFFGSRVVWRVRITGNERLHTSVLEDMLAGYGLEAGRYIPHLDLDELEMKILLECPDIAWISLYLSGTTVCAELRETVRPAAEQDGGSGNLVAAADGLIERIEVYDGNPAVRIGDTVKKGQLLVGGLYDSSSGRVRMTRAKGAVYARTVHEIRVEVPFAYEKKVYTGQESTEKYVKFFGNEIKVFSNTGNESGSCDIIYYEKMLSLPGGLEVPVGVRTAKHLVYTVETAEYSEEEAMELAFYRLSLALGELSDDAELLEKNIRFEITDTGYILVCRVECLENIAEGQKIEIAP